MSLFKPFDHPFFFDPLLPSPSPFPFASPSSTSLLYHPLLSAPACPFDFDADLEFPFHPLPLSSPYGLSAELDLASDLDIAVLRDDLALHSLSDRIHALELGVHRADRDRKYSWTAEYGGDRKCKWTSEALHDDLALHSVSDRIHALELGVHRAALAGRDRKYSWTAEYGRDRKYKWTSEAKGLGDRSVKWEAEVKSPCEDGYDSKYKWAAEANLAGSRKVTWTKELKGKGYHAPWAHTYTWEERAGEASEVKEKLEKKEEKKEEKKYKEEKKKKFKEEEKYKEEEKCKEKKACPVRLVEIEDHTPGILAMRKACAARYIKGKRKEYSPQDAALLIQMNYRAHLARRSQVLRCLRDLAIAKAKLKEIRVLFSNFSYRRRIVLDTEERQRFSEKIIVLLLTVDALEGPDYMVRATKKSMITELEAILDVVDPQPAGKLHSLKCRKFDLPNGGVISSEVAAGVREVVRIIEEESD